MTQLPLEGNTKPAPDWPLTYATEEELYRWEQVWKHPAAVVWDQQQLYFVIARYVRDCIRAEDPKASAILKAEVRQAEDRLGLNPTAMMRLRWEVAQDELNAKRNDEPRRPNASRRLKAVDPEAASG